MKGILLYISLLLFNCSLVLCQPDIDSLNAKWNNNSLPDSIRLSALKDIAWKGYLFSQPDSAYIIAQIQYDYAQERGLEGQMADALNTQGVSFALRGNPETALEYYEQSLAIWKKIGDKEGISNSLNNIGILYKQQGDYDKAIDFYRQSLEINKDIDNKKGEASTLQPPAPAFPMYCCACQAALSDGVRGAGGACPC